MHMSTFVTTYYSYRLCKLLYTNTMMLDCQAILIFPSIDNKGNHVINCAINIFVLIFMYTTDIRTSGSESRGQEEAASTRISGQCDHYSELYTRMVGLNF